MTQRSAEEIKFRCKHILNDGQVVRLVKESSTPSAAFDIILAETRNEEKAKAGRWLAILRRDYPDVFSQVVQ